MEANKAGGASGVDGGTWSMKVVEIRDSVGQDGIPSAGDSIFRVSHQVFCRHGVIIVGETAAENGSLGAIDAVKGNASWKKYQQRWTQAQEGLHADYHPRALHRPLQAAVSAADPWLPPLFLRC